MGDFLPIDDAHWPDAVDDMKDGFAGKLNVYRTMAHHPALLKAWAPLRDHVVIKTALPKQLSEVVILRTGVRLDSKYEWVHHVSRGRACGMEDVRIASIAGSPDEMEPVDGILCGAVDELVLGHALTPSTIAAVIGEVGTDGLFDLIATVGFYMTLGYILKSFGTPVDDDIALEMARNPLELP